MVSWDDGWHSMQEPPQFVLFSRAENGGAAQVRNILNRAVGAHEDAVRQVGMLCQQAVCLHTHCWCVCGVHARAAGACLVHKFALTFLPT